ncbi:MAG: YdcF family protein [Alphaproteobacteria bacterium]|nr:YdcF family protein [Alphaproteobacteria bacterium]
MGDTFFFLSKLAWWFIEPSNAVVFAIAIAIVLLFAGRVRTGRNVLLAVAIFVGALSLLPIPDIVVGTLEQRFPRPDPLPEKVDGIILLGGAQIPRMTEEYGTPALNGAANTVTTFLWLGRQYPDAKLVFTGGSGDPLERSLNEAETLRLFLIQQGFDANRVLYEKQSRNTYENAALSKSLADPRPGETWILVTQALHVPRSVGAFRKVGWDVTPYSEAYRYGRHIHFGPPANVREALAIFSTGVREWIGLLAYRVTGRSDAFLPSPR